MNRLLANSVNNRNSQIIMMEEDMLDDVEENISRLMLAPIQIVYRQSYEDDEYD
jgi:hypothetical protein